jgi:hypothetical protein
MKLTHSVELVRKPALSVMGFLAYLQDYITFAVQGVQPAAGATLGVMATCRTQSPAQAGIVIYNSPDSAPTTGVTDVSLTLHWNVSQAQVAAFVLDNTRGNAMTAWERFGKPIYPNASVWQAMRDAAEIVLLDGFPRAWSPEQKVEISVPLPGIVLLHMCADTPPALSAPTDVKLYVPRSTTPVEVLVSWSDEAMADSRCVLTFEVLYAVSAAAEYHRINRLNTIMNYYLHQQLDQKSSPVGCYRVAGVDYWGRTGAMSDAVCL